MNYSQLDIPSYKVSYFNSSSRNEVSQEKKMGVKMILCLANWR